MTNEEIKELVAERIAGAALTSHGVPNGTTKLVYALSDALAALVDEVERLSETLEAADGLVVAMRDTQASMARDLSKARDEVERLGKENRTLIVENEKLRGLRPMDDNWGRVS